MKVAIGELKAVRDGGRINLFIKLNPDCAVDEKDAFNIWRTTIVDELINTRWREVLREGVNKMILVFVFECCRDLKG